MKHIKGKSRRIKRIRSKIKALSVLRLTVNRTSKHIYAQVFNENGSKVLACASSLEKEVREKHHEDKGKINVAITVGTLVAKRAVEKGIKKVAFDRSGFRFHGRIKALAEAARKHGLQC